MNQLIYTLRALGERPYDIHSMPLQNKTSPFPFGNGEAALLENYFSS